MAFQHSSKNDPLRYIRLTRDCRRYEVRVFSRVMQQQIWCGSFKALAEAQLARDREERMHVDRSQYVKPWKPAKPRKKKQPALYKSRICDK